MTRGLGTQLPGGLITVLAGSLKTFGNGLAFGLSAQLVSFLTMLTNATGIVRVALTQNALAFW